MQKRLIFILLILGITTSAFAQEKNMWKTLSNVTVEKSFDEILSIDVEHYNFAGQVKALNGKKISLEGWMIPLDELRGENYFVLSSLPFANCFFCGGAGPETVAEVFSKKEVKFTEKKIRVTGVLTLNSDDPLRLMYILNDVEVEEVKD